jgi:dephospho-CoA kinase
MKKIGIIGQQCAGKTTITKLIQEIYENNTVYILKFAEPIYQSWAALHQDFKNRGYMQEFGDLAKKYCGLEVFARCFEINVADAIQIHMKDNDILVCDDIRYQYEVDTALKLGFKILAVEADKDIRRQRAMGQGLDFIEGHNSETEIPTLISEADYVLINNDITTEHLRDNTNVILNRMFGPV